MLLSAALSTKYSYSVISHHQNSYGCVKCIRHKKVTHLVSSSCSVCLSGSSYWSRRAQRGSCVLRGKRWGWSRAAAVAAAVGVWCGDGDTHSSSSKWRWSPKPTKTLQWEEDQHCHVMFTVIFYNTHAWWRFKQERLCSTISIMFKMFNPADQILPRSGSNIVKDSHACIL